MNQVISKCFHSLKVSHKAFDYDLKHYDKLDGIFAIVFWLLIQGIHIIFYNPIISSVIKQTIYRCSLKIIHNLPAAVEVSQFVVQIILPVIRVFLPPLIIVIYMIIRKQKISTLGFRKRNNIKAVLIGLAGGCLAALFIELFQGLFFPQYNRIHWEKLSFSCYNFIYYFVLIGLYEEVSFRAFIMSHMAGLIKNKVFLVLVVGLMFWESHLYNDIMSGSYTAQIYILQACTYLLLHIWWLYLYRKTDNILAAAVCHGLYDFIIMTTY